MYRTKYSVIRNIETKYRNKRSEMYNNIAEAINTLEEGCATNDTMKKLG